MKIRRVLLGFLALSIGAACTGTSTPTPSASLDPSREPAGGSGGSGAIDTPIRGPVPGRPIGGPNEPGQAQFVVPHPGQQNVHPVAVTNLEVAIGEQSVAVRASWWSGIEPCTRLDSVVVRREKGIILITVREGSPPNAANVACIDIAVLKATLIDLGRLPAGVYTVRTTDGDAVPVTVTVD